MHEDDIKDAVREKYSAVAKGTASRCCGGGNKGSCDDAKPSIASTDGRDLGYSDAELAALPEGASLGLGCGNPQAIASLKAGDTVLDLGSGAGIDCFLAARQVGSNGRVIGVDMTPEMLQKGRANARTGGFANVEFRLGEIEHLPVADASIDVIVSNCVVNLSPDKEQVYRECFRVLKSGGRVAMSDIVATAELPAEMKKDMAAYTGCMAGASRVGDLAAMLQRAGFTDVRIEPKDSSRAFLKQWVPGKTFEDYVLAGTITARKP